MVVGDGDVTVQIKTVQGLLVQLIHRRLDLGLEASWKIPERELRPPDRFPASGSEQVHSTAP